MNKIHGRESGVKSLEREKLWREKMREGGDLLTLDERGILRERETDSIQRDR
jgi:hypothetical protein